MSGQFLSNLSPFYTHKSCEQCVFREASTRTDLLERFPFTPAHLNSKRARDAYREKGLMPFVEVAFEDPRFAPLMGGVSLMRRMPGDPLHLVRDWCLLRSQLLV